MDILAWTVWGLAGAAYAATLLLTSRAERRFMNDPHGWASNGRAIVVPPATRLPRTTPAPRPGRADLQAPGLVREVA